MKKFVLAVAITMFALMGCSGQHYGTIDATPQVKVPVVVVPEEVKIDYSIMDQMIYFDFDDAELTDEAMAILVKKAEWLKQYPEMDLLIEGHCDKRGTNDYNLDLGLKRAENTRYFLIEKGIDPERLEVETYNSTVLADPNSHKMNRRCEFTVM